MILQFANVLLVAAILVSGFFIYSLEHEIRAGERRISELENAIAEEEETKHQLSVEWANLSNPQRIERLARTHLPHLQPMKPQQVIPLYALPQRLPDAAAASPALGNEEPIGNMLKVME
ncbi:MAG: cell division protein FtsL [Aestuariivirgaceae bacterium]|nr:cell division protein FtsL [Aestuariivirgaceae bacterium]